MKKIYVFTNYFDHKRKGRPFYWIEIVAETILDAKRRVKEEFSSDVKFLRIKEVL